jgi:Tol biopolymer transport system component
LIAGTFNFRGASVPSPGIVVFRLDSQKYEAVTSSGDSGSNVTWLSDSRRLIYKDGNKLMLVDTVTKKSHEILTFQPGSDLNNPVTTFDDRWIYFDHSANGSDIWLLTWK